MNTKDKLPYAEGAEVPQRSQKKSTRKRRTKLFLHPPFSVYFCVLRATFASSADGCPLAVS